MKKIILFLILTPLLLGAACTSDDTIDSDFNIYYQNLNQQCEYDQCCSASIRSMKVGNFKLMPETGCLDSQLKNMLKCETSYVWCEGKD